MSAMTERSVPRFNHVAMSVPADLLDEDGRRDLVRFYSEVFGWQELPTETVDRKQLVLSAYRYDQFVFLIADDDPMSCPRLDHFGMGVDSMEQLDDILERAHAYAAHDDRVEIVEKKTEHHPGLDLTNFYVGYRLPLMVEVQHFAWTAAAAP
jgi:hypothetical protein